MIRNIERANSGLSDQDLAAKQEYLFSDHKNLTRKAEVGNARLDRAFDLQDSLEQQIENTQNPVRRLGLEAIAKVQGVAVNIQGDIMVDNNMRRYENVTTARNLNKYSGGQLQEIAKQEMDDSLAERADAA